MTRRERLTTLSAAQCCVCDMPLSLQELDEFISRADETLHGTIHCRHCAEAHLTVCRECSGRYVTGGVALCGECTTREYALAG